MDLPARARALVVLTATPPWLLEWPIRRLPLPSFHRQSSASVELVTAPALPAMKAPAHSKRPARNEEWAVPLRLRYRGLGRSRGAMSGARRATVVTPARSPLKHPGPATRRRVLDEVAAQAAKLQTNVNEFIGLAVVTEVELPGAVYETNVELLGLLRQLRDLAARGSESEVPPGHAGDAERGGADGR